MTTTSPNADPGVAAEDRPKHSRGATILCWVIVLPTASWALLRFAGWERGPLVQLIAFTPYVAAWSLLPVTLTYLLRRWTAAAIATFTLLLMAAAVLPRAVPDGHRGASAGVTLRVLTANLLVGRADPTAIVRLVREHDVAVLAVQEFTPEAATGLAAAGLGGLLPHLQSGAEDDTTGSGLYSRFPITAGGIRRNGGGFLQAYGTITAPGGPAVLVESVHPLAPATQGALTDWRADLAAQPRATPHGPLRILLGDFNATLDHAALRQLIASGYHDAADTTGAGLIGTWGPYDGDRIPPVTIDHVLVDQRIGVTALAVHHLPNSDHRAVLAALTLPAP